MSESLKKFQSLLCDLFQLEYSDVDTGIYRLFHLRKEAVEAFIQEELPVTVNDAFGAVLGDQTRLLEQQLEKKKREIRSSLGDDAVLADGSIAKAFSATPMGAAYEAIRKQLADMRVSAEQRRDVFNHLYNFFSRYYDDADFLPLRRYGSKTESYAVPYNGEEVMFHWATRGMHYIKTGEQFRDYQFKVSALDNKEWTVRFKVTDANVPKDNTKGDARYFFPLVGAMSVDGESSALTIPFHYRPPTEAEAANEAYQSTPKAKKPDQQKIIEAHLPAIWDTVADQCGFLVDALKQTLGDGDKAVPLLQKRMLHFTRKNTTDYFICPFLKAFLTRELEFYLKDWVFSLEDLQGDFPAKWRSVEVIRRVAHRIIDFLDSIEQAQNRLWEKPKFVLQTDWLVPIRHVSEKLWKDVLANKRQLAEWQKWFATPETVDACFLQTHPTLALSTAHFDDSFKRRLLETLPFDSIEEATDGLLIHSENYQALNLLRHKYAGKVKCVYIDPPYNTDASSILYKNDYKHSSWLSLIEDRIRETVCFLECNGILCLAIDDEEVSGVRRVLEQIFPKTIGISVVRSNPQSRKTKGKFSPTHEYAMFYGISEDAVPGFLEITEKRLTRYPLEDASGRYAWMNFIRSGNNDRRDDRPKLYYPIFVSENNMIRIPKMSWSDKTGVYGTYILDESPRKDEIAVYPTAKKNGGIVEKNWHRGPARVTGEPEEFRVRRDKTGKVSIDFKTRMDVNSMPATWWDHNEYASANYGASELKALFGYKPFDFPKALRLVCDCLRASGVAPASLVLDFFAGSGTTGHAVINLNRKDGGLRRFMLVEMGEYFDTVLMPRIAKVMYAPEWKDGKPKEEPVFDGLPKLGLPDWMERSPRLVKILRLESYEDAMHNLSATAEKLAVQQGDVVKLQYMFTLPMREADTMLNVDKLERPFSYTLEVLTDAGPKEKQVDLVETANMLLGLAVDQYETWRAPGGREYLAVQAHKEDKRWLVIWRDMEGLDIKAERKFLEPRITGFDEVRINGDCAVPGIASIDLDLSRIWSA